MSHFNNFIPRGPKARKYISKVIRHFNQLDKSSLKICCEYDPIINKKKDMYLTINLNNSDEKIIIWYDSFNYINNSGKCIMYDNKIEIYETENDLYHGINRCLNYFL